MLVFSRTGSFACLLSHLLQVIRHRGNAVLISFMTRVSYQVADKKKKKGYIIVYANNLLQLYIDCDMSG